MEGTGGLRHRAAADLLASPATISATSAEAPNVTEEMTLDAPVPRRHSGSRDEPSPLCLAQTPDPKNHDQ